MDFKVAMLCHQPIVHAYVSIRVYLFSYFRIKVKDYRLWIWDVSSHLQPYLHYAMVIRYICRGNHLPGQKTCHSVNRWRTFYHIRLCQKKTCSCAKVEFSNLCGNGCTIPWLSRRFPDVRGFMRFNNRSES